MMKKILHLSLVFSLLLMGACKDNESGTKRVDFDERAMLENYGDNLILPGYALLRQRTETLRTRVQEFVATPTEVSLAAAQQAHRDAWLAWQGVSIYEFGPGLELNLRRNINTFPTQYPKINTAIQSGNWDINGLYSHDIRGFSALDYLLYSETGDHTAILERFTTNAQAANWKRFAQDVATHLHTQAEAAYNKWSPAGGNYLGTFNTNTGNSASNSLSLLVNQIIQGFEVTKNKRVREPLGLESIDNQPAPRNVEAFYSGLSKELLLANLQAMENILKGTYASGDGLGLTDYLQAHYTAGNTQTDLAKEIDEQLQVLQDGVSALTVPLRVSVVENREELTRLYNEMVSFIALIKADMPSVLSVRVEDYGDIDGD